VRTTSSQASSLSSRSGGLAQLTRAAGLYRASQGTTRHQIQATLAANAGETIIGPNAKPFAQGWRQAYLPAFHFAFATKAVSRVQRLGKIRVSVALH